MIRRFKARGNWKSGVNDQFVDIKVLDVFVTFLPWALAFEALVRGWEYMRIRGLFLENVTPPLVPVAGEGAFNFPYFGLVIFTSGLTLIVGLSFRRFIPIIFACLLGAASYLLLSVSYLTEMVAGDSGTGLRNGVLFLVISGLWIFKGFFAASKKTLDQVKREADAQTEEVIND